jgi:hypothetical protein
MIVVDARIDASLSSSPVSRGAPPMTSPVRVACWLCEQPGPARIFDLEMQLRALGWRCVREGEWLCRECTTLEDRAPSSTLRSVSPLVLSTKPRGSR